jgi:hypothetical protein
MPRESSDARAALMAVYLSQRQRPYCLSPSDMPSSTKKLKPAERPPCRKKYAKDLAMTTVFAKNVKNIPHRRRRDAEEWPHTIRASSSGLGIGLGRTGRTIYGVGEASGGVIRRQRRRNINKTGTSSSSPEGTSQGGGGGLRKAQVAVIKMGEEVTRREAEARRVQGQKETRKKGDYTCGHGDDMLPLRETDGEGVRAEDVAHADRYFDMYINAEAWVVN